MSATVVTETIVDIAASRDRLAHLECGIANQQPDEPMHALCGHPLLGVDAPRQAPHCGDCERRMNAGGPVFAWLGALRCDQHPMGSAPVMGQP